MNIKDSDLQVTTIPGAAPLMACTPGPRGRVPACLQLRLQDSLTLTVLFGIHLHAHGAYTGSLWDFCRGLQEARQAGEGKPQFGGFSQKS